MTEAKGLQFWKKPVFIGKFPLERVDYLMVKSRTQLSELSTVPGCHRWLVWACTGGQRYLPLVCKMGAEKLSCSPVSLYNMDWGEIAACIDEFGYDFLTMNSTGGYFEAVVVLGYFRGVLEVGAWQIHTPDWALGGSTGQGRGCEPGVSLCARRTNSRNQHQWNWRRKSRKSKLVTAAGASVPLPFFAVASKSPAECRTPAHNSSRHPMLIKVI